MDLDQIYQEHMHLACVVRMHETFFLEVKKVVTVYFSHSEMVAKRLTEICYVLHCLWY